MTRSLNKATLEAPVFPLPNAILFPGVLLPLHIFEQRYKLMVESALEGNRRLAISLLRKDGDGTWTPSTICGLGEIVRVEELDDGEKDILVRGIGRVALREVRQEAPYMTGLLQPVGDLPRETPPGGPALREIAHLAQQLIFLLDMKDGARWMNLVGFMEDPSLLADFVSFYFLQDMTLKQDLLETLDVSIRMRRLKSALEGAIHALET
ncbi:MAG: LON peptidase substrate-binding domain-containing protein [Myxococcota bacterium]